MRFNYRHRDTGAPLAKISVEHVVSRDDLVRAAEVALVDLLPGIPEQADVMVAAKHLNRRLVENTLRSLFESYGRIYFDSYNHDLNCGDLESLVKAEAATAVTRLYPELAEAQVA